MFEPSAENGVTRAVKTPCSRSVMADVCRVSGPNARRSPRNGAVFATIDRHRSPGTIGTCSHMASIFPGRRTAISIPSERPLAAGPPCLVIISGDDMGRRFELGKTEVSIGRADTCTICVNTDQVSRKHASVQHILGRYYVVDLRSTNGTFVNEQKVERAKLLDGDQI